MSQSHFTPLPNPREIKVSTPSPRPLRGGILSGNATLFSFSVAIPGFTPQRGGRGGDRTGDDLHRIEIGLELGNKVDLLEIGKAKMGDSRRNEALSQNDKPSDPLPPVNTQKEIAKAAGTSTAQATAARTEEGDLGGNGEGEDGKGQAESR
jgi:hypothetical protein